MLTPWAGSPVPYRNIHDGELPVTVQCTSVRLMLNLVEVVMQRRTGALAPQLEAHRSLLASILATLSDTLAALARHTPALLAEGAPSQPQTPIAARDLAALQARRFFTVS